MLKLRRIGGTHGPATITVEWDNGQGSRTESFRVARSGDGCVTIDCEKNYWYDGQELYLLAEAVQAFAQESKDRHDAARKERDQWRMSEEIGLLQWPVTNEEGKNTLSMGYAFQGYCLSYVGLTREMNERFGPCDVWYTERNGDPIVMVCPKGTSIDRLPSVAMEYMALEWIKPEAEFGSGVIPRWWKRSKALVALSETLKG